MERLEPRVVLSARPVITEFMADNNNTLLDGDGNSPDWIEIYNAGDSPTDLIGYHLTDDAAFLQKWTFPSVNLEPGQYFVVFASSPADGMGGILNNYVDAGGNLHTNFTLDADGEYLALVEPDGVTVATEFAPSFPEQFEDIAYGVEQQASFNTLLESRHAGKLLVPDAANDAAIGSTWTGASEPFNDSAWQDVIAGVGFDEIDGPIVQLTNVALGKSVTQSTSGFGFDGALAVDGARSGNSISHTDTGDLNPWMEINLAEDFLIERIDVYTRDNCCTPGSPERDYNLVVEVRDEEDAVLFTSAPFNPWDGSGGAALDVGNGASFAVDLTSEAGGGITGHKVRVSKTVFGGSSHSEWLHMAEVEVFAQAEVITTAENLALNKPTSGDVAFGRPPSNGVDGSVGSFTHSENVGPVFWQVDLETANNLGRIEVINRGDGCCPERLNGAVLSVLDENQEALFRADPFANAGVGETIVLDNGGAGFRGARFIRIDHSNQYLTIAELRAFAPENYEVFIETDIEASLKGINSSAYVRFPFNVADAGVFDQLTLGMNYDDGFVAYLNGTEIARNNAPLGTPAYTAAATAENPGALFEEFSVPIPLLQTGDNILAVHGMNLTTGDDDFLILPKLIAREVPTGDTGYLIDPTPGHPNSVSFQGFVSDTRFDVDRGFYDAPFDVNISTGTAGATIIYTTDGSLPSLDNGTQVPAADADSLPLATVPISTTTTLRAAAFKDDFAPTNTDTQSYIFLNDVIRQPANPSGLPSVWDGIAQSPINADYQMDPDVVDDPAYRDETIDGLKAIPTISIVMDSEDLFGAERGIYINSGQRGRAWEHPTSVEIIEPDGSSFQVDSGIRIHGFSWRFHSNSPKHGFRLEFRDEYGPNKLEYPLFPDAPVDRFDSIVLRQQGGRAWAGLQNPNQAQYLRDTFARDLAREMGATDGHATLVHLYLNGMYWGLYNPVERPDAQMGEEYFGGSDEDYDALNRRTSTTEAIDGDLVRYNEMIALANSALAAGVTTDDDLAQFERYVAMDDFIDWFIRNQYVTNRDGLSAFDGNNQRAIGSRVGDPQFRFFVWDMEYSMWNATDNNNIAPGRNSPALAGSQNPPAHAWTVYNALRQHPEFLLRYADRVQKHLFNDGALTPEKAAETWEARARSIEQAIIAESARWGDAKRSTPYTRDVEWQTERNRLLTQYFPQRTDILVSQYRDAGLYPEISAPVFQINGNNQHGGPISAGDTLTMTAKAATITTDTVLVEKNADVRAFIPSNDSLETGAPRWYDADFDATGWISGTGVVGFGADFVARIGLNVQDEWNASQSSVYVRYEFDLDAGFTAADIERLNLEIKFDDGYVIYVNGQEIHSDAAPASAEWDSRASSAESNLVHKLVDRYESLDLADAIGALQPGKNVLAIRGLAHDSDLGHLLVGAELTMSDDVAVPAPIVYTLDGTDPRAVGGANVGITYDSVIPLNGSTHVNARAFVNGEWSALSTTTFGVPSSSGDVLITEINYNPSDPTTVELLANPDLNNDDFEFVEVLNVGADPFNLIGIEFSNGIDFAFPSVELGSNEYGVVVKDITAFQLRYGSSVNVLGEYDGNLRNSGEQIEVLDPLGATILDFEYGDSDPWPSRTDGAGGTLVLVDPTSTPANEFGKYYRWKGSSEFGGSPGTVGMAAPGVVITEVLTNTDESPTQSDAIELHNTTASPVDISGWFLSDSSADLLKFEIPNGTIVGANEYVVFDENDFNPNPEAPSDGDFALDGDDGDDVWLVIPDDGGGIKTFVDDVHFGAARLDESLGRVPDGSPRLAPLSRTTLGCDNSHARVGPLVISEIHYAPSAPSLGAGALGLTRDDLQFIEIYNPTTSGIDLTDWRIRGGIDFDFPASTRIGAGETIVLVSFDPAFPGNANLVEGFALHHGVDLTRLMGDFAGRLSDNGELIRLQRPGDPPIGDPDFIPRLIEDSVLYDTVPPWPEPVPLGPGLSIERIAPVFNGSAVASWSTSVGSPGFVSFTNGVDGDLTGDSIANAADIDALYDAIARGSATEFFDLDGNLTVNSTDVTFLVQDIIGTFMGDTNLDGLVSSADLNQVGLHWQATNCVGWSTGDVTGDGKVNAGDLNVLGINWLSGIALAASQPVARVPRAPLAAAPGPAIVMEAVFGDETQASWLSHYALDRSANVSRASRADHPAELGVTELANSKHSRWQIEKWRRRLIDSSKIDIESEQVVLLDQVFAQMFNRYPRRSCC